MLINIFPGSEKNRGGDQFGRRDPSGESGKDVGMISYVRRREPVRTPTLAWLLLNRRASPIGDRVTAENAIRFLGRDDDMHQHERKGD